MPTKHMPNSAITQHTSAANGIPIQLQMHQQQQQPLPIKIKTSKKWILPPRPKPGRKPSQSLSSSSNHHYSSPSSPSSTSCSINKDSVNTASPIRKKLKASCSSITGCSSNKSSRIKSKSLSPSPSPSSIESSPYANPSSSSYQGATSPHSHRDTIVESSKNNSPSPISEGNNLDLLDESIILNNPIKKEILKINEENYYLKLQVIKLVSDLKNLKKNSCKTVDVVKVKLEEKVVTQTTNDKKRSHDDDINDLIISLIDLNHSQQTQSTPPTAASSAPTITTANDTIIDNDTETITGGDYEDNLDYEEDFDLLTNESTTPIDLDNNQHPHPFENTTNVSVSNAIKKDEMLSLIKTNETIDSCISSSSSTLINNSIDDNHSNHYYLPEKKQFQLFDIPNTSPIAASDSIFSNSDNGDGSSNSIFKLTFESKLNERINEGNDLTDLDDLYEKDYYTFTDMSNMNNYNYNNNNNETNEINNDKNTTAITRISNDLNNGININKGNKHTNSINTIPNNVNTEFEKFINGELN